MLATSMLEAIDVHRYYGDRCAVSALSFRIEAGASVGLLGLNGAGKSTTLRMLAGLSAPTRGTIRLRGEILSPEAHDLRAKIGFLPDKPPLYDAMTVEAYLRFAARLRGVSQAALSQRLNYVIDVCDLSRVASDAILTLSHGFRQRVGIAQAIVHAPSLVVLDEPSQGLDPAQRLGMRALVRALKAKHTVVLSTHLLSEISQCCDRVLMLHEGRLHAEGSEGEIVQRLSQHSKHGLTLVARGDKTQVEQTLKGVSGVTEVRLRTQGEEQHAELVCDRDVRAAVSRCLIDAGADLLELRPSSEGLEAVFASLVSPPEVQA